MHRLLSTAFAASLALGAALPAAGQSAAEAPVPHFAETTPSAAEGILSTQGRDRRLVFSVLLGAESRPEYFGSEDNRAVPTFRPNLLALDFGALDVGDADAPLTNDPLRRPLGFAAGTSFRFIGERSADEYDELDGLDDVDATLEVGASAFYVWPNAEAYGMLRYGLGGSDAWVGEMGAYYVTRPVEGFAFRIGPRLLFGSDQYADTYFGVTETEATASGLEAYDPDGGLVSAGVEVIASYRLGEFWWLEGRARWDQFQNDAADSPIVDQGARDQGTVSIGVRRAFVLNF